MRLLREQDTRIVAKPHVQRQRRICIDGKTVASRRPHSTPPPKSLMTGVHRLDALGARHALTVTGCPAGRAARGSPGGGSRAGGRIGCEQARTPACLLIVRRDRKSRHRARRPPWSARQSHQALEGGVGGRSGDVKAPAVVGKPVSLARRGLAVICVPRRGRRRLSRSPGSPPDRRRSGGDKRPH